MKIRIGITGENGFIGSHIKRHLSILKDEFEVIHFQKHFFESEVLMDTFVLKCDVIIHLAAKNRHADSSILYEINVSLVKKLITSLNRTNSGAHVIFSSSSQELNNNLYGDSKKQGRYLFVEWAKLNNGKFTGIMIPNVFGPFGLPKYNSFIATFCHQLIHGEDVKIDCDSLVPLIYISELVNQILIIIREKLFSDLYVINHTKLIRVSDVYKLLLTYKESYLDNSTIPDLGSSFELNLFNTFRSFIDINRNPIYFKKHHDNRGEFVELIKLQNGGQVSFSTTNPDVVRGNHFHTRKVERFAVIKGQAIIQLRKIGTNKVYEFKVSGEQPAYVDIPIWYTHNIKNIGEEILYTIFWINEIYRSEDPDTFLEDV